MAHLDAVLYPVNGLVMLVDPHDKTIEFRRETDWGSEAIPVEEASRMTAEAPAKYADYRLVSA